MCTLEAAPNVVARRHPQLAEHLLRVMMSGVGTDSQGICDAGRAEFYFLQ